MGRFAMNHRRRIAYVSGTRADFGLMQSTLQAIQASPALELGVIVTGMHLDDKYGHTEQEILAAHLPIIARVPIQHGEATGALVARNIAAMLSGCVDALEAFRPACVVVLGDRGEMLAAAIAGGHLSIPVIHLHGGERSGTIDESVRHAISKLAHYHLTATEESRERLIKMGEDRQTVTVVGAPGLDGLEAMAFHTREEAFARLGLDPSHETALLVYHPVLQEAGQASEQIEAILEPLLEKNLAILALKPNSDAGSGGILDVLNTYAATGQIKLVTHLERREFVSMLKHADMLVGNSSSGIIEAASFGTPVVNIGSRQHLRQRNRNVIDTQPDSMAIASAIDQARAMGRPPIDNVYGDGRTGVRIVNILETLELPGTLLNKANAY
ncbi:UDP-N-acetylglucosamine 2-epimerase [Devosia sp. A369]